VLPLLSNSTPLIFIALIFGRRKLNIILFGSPGYGAAHDGDSDWHTPLWIEQRLAKGHYGKS
jgi:hypothetical protein